MTKGLLWTLDMTDREPKYSKYPNTPMLATVSYLINTPYSKQNMPHWFITWILLVVAGCQIVCWPHLAMSQALSVAARKSLCQPIIYKELKAGSIRTPTIEPYALTVLYSTTK